MLTRCVRVERPDGMEDVVHGDGEKESDVPRRQLSSSRRCSMVIVGVNVVVVCLWLLMAEMLCHHRMVHPSSDDAKFLMLA